MADWAKIRTPDIEAAIRERQPQAREVRVRKRSRFRPTMGATGSYFERVQVQIDGREVPAVLKLGSLPVGPPVREALFFSELAGEVPIRSASCLAVGPPLDSAGGDAWVLMSRLPRGKRLIDWTREDTVEALRNLARLHAQYLGEAPADLPRPMTAQLEESLSFIPAGVRELRAVFEEHPGLPRFARDRALDLLLELCAQPQIFRAAFVRSPETLLHGDYHRGNLIARDGEEQIAFDWQFCCAGPPACDLGVFWHHLGIVTKPLFFRFIDRADIEERSLRWDEVTAIYAEALRTLRPDADIAGILSCSEEALCWEVVRQVTYMAAGMTETHGGIFRFVYRDHRTIGGWLTRLVGIDRLWVVYEQLFADFEARAARLLQR